MVPGRIVILPQAFQSLLVRPIAQLGQHGRERCSRNNWLAVGRITHICFGSKIELSAILNSCHGKVWR
eukprot:9483404-Pyramimonas_sp.AAC.1